MRQRPMVFAGCGPGATELVTPATWMAALSAEHLCGPQRLIDLFPGAAGKRVVLPDAPQTALEEMARLHAAGERFTQLVEGDAVGDRWVRRAVRRFTAGRCRVLPGVSTVSAALAAIDQDTQGLRVVDPLDDGPEGGDAAPEGAAAPDRGWEGHGRLVIYAGDAGRWRWATALAAALEATHTTFVCDNLTLPGQRAARMMAYEMGGWIPRALTMVVLVHRRHWPR